MLYEIKIAQNFVLGLLYNKLPRRHVNLFGEELEAALKDKFADHWYPDIPFRGSAFRCVKLTDPSDLVLIRAATRSGNSLDSIIDNLPSDLAIWIDPGEVSCRIGERGSVKLLYSSEDKQRSEQFSTFVDVPSGLELADSNPNEDIDIGQTPMMRPPLENLNYMLTNMTLQTDSGFNSSSGFQTTSEKPHHQYPLTYTAGTFAQTKFGSTKLKSNGKKVPHRMSPTEFSNYIKQRSIQKYSSSCTNTNKLTFGTNPALPSNFQNGYEIPHYNHHHFQNNLNNRGRSQNPSSGISSAFSRGMRGISASSSVPLYPSHQKGFAVKDEEGISKDLLSHSLSNKHHGMGPTNYYNSNYLETLDGHTSYETGFTLGESGFGNRDFKV